ncbi:hypothetical protein QTP88_000353 [Uroleucon formosanum]
MSIIESEDEDVMSDITSEDEDVMSDIKCEDRDVMGDIKCEDKDNRIYSILSDIAELKKEISDIIDEECVVRIYKMINNETNPKSEWSSKLSFFNLLLKLRVNEQDGLSIPFIFVGLLHLASERCLRLIKEHCIINDFEETFIIKPMK